MSSHSMSASGDRSFNLSAGGGARTGFTVPSRQTDGIQFQASGFSRIEIPLYGGARLERVEIEVESKYDEKGNRLDEPRLKTEEVLALVWERGESGSPNMTLWGHPSGDGDNPGPENTSFDARKPGEKFGAFAYYDGEPVVVESKPVSEVFATDESA